jgi:hypothetical protein
VAKSKGPSIKFVEAKPGYSKIFDPPVLASTVLPKWYKDQNLNIGNKMFIDPKSGTTARTIKACMPVFDLITAGYMIKCPAEILFQKDDFGAPSTSWSVDNIGLIESHSREQFSEFSVPEEYYSGIALKFINPWIVKTPPGYSTMFITPAMRDDLPFYCIPAIVDTDKHPSPINFPFFIKKDFEGIIGYDTPIIQMIPFKREDWSHEVMESDEALEYVVWQHAKRKIQNRYKTFFRTKKVWK